MTETHARVVTPHAGKYLQQLCKHWGHRFTVTFTPTEGHVDFGKGETLDLAADDLALTLRAVAADPAGLAPLSAVIAEHLQRFAFRETLVFDWQ